MVLSEMWEFVKSAFAVLGAVGISAVTLAAAAYALFRFLGEKWISQKFAQQLESYKSDQARELERVRHKINGIFDRTKRLHDREFEILPEVWAKVVEAKFRVAGYIALFQQYADISRMTDEDLSEFLDAKSFSNAQKRAIREATDRQAAYTKTSELYRNAEVVDKLREANIDLSKRGIFIVPSLREPLKRLIDMMFDAVLEHQFNLEDNGRRKRDAADKLKNDGEQLFKEIEDLVASRLWDSTTAEI